MFFEKFSEKREILSMNVNYTIINLYNINEQDNEDTSFSNRGK